MAVIAEVVRTDAAAIKNKSEKNSVVGLFNRQRKFYVRIEDYSTALTLIEFITG